MNGTKFSTAGSSIPKVNKSDATSQEYGQNQTDVYNWLSHIVMPANYDVCNIVEVKFKGSRKEFYINLTNTILKNGELVVVAGSKGGYDVGHVSVTGELVRMQLKKKNVRTKNVLKKIYRRANYADIITWKLAKNLELDALSKARVLAKKLSLSMKLTDVDYQGDRTKATFYYTAEGRVDYRELIKNLFDTFGVQIEMRQIGMREEANRIGDIGPCGSYICCHNWSTNFKTNYPFASRSEKSSNRVINKFNCYIKDETLDSDGNKSDDVKKEIQRKNTNEPSSSLLYTNIVGQDSITRFDNKRKSKKNRTRPKN
jgi:cell fate regulator YaaT (PSP1 superfamily)